MGFQEYPKMIYHDKRAPRVVKDKDEETAALSQGYKLQAPSQFEENEAGVDPTREPAIVSQIEQEKTRLAGNQGAKDPAELLGENGDENAEDEPPAPKKKAGK
jgi:hypothetical protein